MVNSKLTIGATKIRNYPKGFRDYVEQYERTFLMLLIRYRKGENNVGDSVFLFIIIVIMS